MYFKYGGFQGASRPSSILIMNIFFLYIIVKQKQTRSNKGFNFDINIFLKISMIFINECRTHTGCPKKQNDQKTLQQGDSRIKPGGGDNIFFIHPPPLLVRDFLIPITAKNAKLPCKIYAICFLLSKAIQIDILSAVLQYLKY